MKKIFLIFIALFFGIPCFAASTGPFSAWYDCIDKINKEENNLKKQLSEKFFGKKGDKVPEYVVHDNQGNIVQIEMNDIVNEQIQPITTRASVINILFNFMSEHCEEYFANMISQAYRAKNNGSVVFDFYYGNDIIVRGKVIPEHATINIYPKTDVDVYPKLVGVWISGNAQAYDKGTIISQATANKNGNFWSTACSPLTYGPNQSLINAAGRSTFGYAQGDRDSRYYISTNGIGFNGLILSDHWEWGGGQSGAGTDILFIQTYEEKDSDYVKIKQFIDKVVSLEEEREVCHRNDGAFRIYTVVMDKSKATQNFRIPHNAGLGKSIQYTDVGAKYSSGRDIDNIVIKSDFPENL